MIVEAEDSVGAHSGLAGQVQVVFAATAFATIVTTVVVDRKWVAALIQLFVVALVGLRTLVATAVESVQ